MKNYEYILFDLDGTLLDSKKGIVNCIKYALDSKGIKYTDDVLDKMIGPPFRVSMHDFLGLERDVIEELITLYRGRYAAGGWRECSIFDGVEDMLKSLLVAGKKLGLATSKPLKYARIMMDEMGLSKYFLFIGGASSDLSRELKCDIIQMNLDKMNITDKSKVLMVGDRLYDIEGAKICGVDCAAVLYGYGSREEFEKWGANYILSTPDDVVSLVV